MPATSLSVCRSKIGTSVSVRNVVGGPRIVAPTSGGLGARGHNHRRAGPAHDEEPVEGAGERLDAVDVGGQPERSLRVTQGEDLGRHLATGGRAAGPQRAGHLGDDVEGEPVAGVVQRPVALGVDGPEALAEQVGAPGTSCLPGPRGGVGATATFPPSTPIFCAETPTQVWPWRTISLRRFWYPGSVSSPPLTLSHSSSTMPSPPDAGRRTTIASPVARRVGGLEGPPAVGGERSNRLVRRRAAFRGVLLLDVAGAQRLRRRRPQEHPVAPGQPLRDVGGRPVRSGHFRKRGRHGGAEGDEGDDEGSGLGVGADDGSPEHPPASSTTPITTTAVCAVTWRRGMDREHAPGPATSWCSSRNPEKSRTVTTCGPTSSTSRRTPFGYRCHANTGVKFPA